MSQVHQATETLRISSAERVQDVAAARIPDQDWLFQIERRDHFKDVVCPSLRTVSGRRTVRGTDATPRHGVHMKPIGQLRRDAVVDVCRQVTADKYQRTTRATPVEHLKANRRIDRDETDLVR